MLLGVVVFQKDEEFTTSKNRLLTVLPELGREYSVTFQLLVTSVLDHNFQNIIHFTIGGDSPFGRGEYGDRTPGLWTGFRKFYVASAIDGNSNYGFYASIPNSWHCIEISQLSDGSEVL